jgi:uncharacterized protein YndB with AHSA1/START domain
MKRLLLPLLLSLAPCLVAWAAPHEAYNEAVIATSQAEAWAAFTTRQGLESWMVAKAQVDLRLGGLLRTRYAADGEIGDDATIDSQLLSFDAPRMYSTRIAKPPKGFPFPNAWKDVWTVVYFESLGPASTKVSVRMLGYTDDEESQKMRAFFQRGNQYTLDKLAAKYPSASPAAKP